MSLKENRRRRLDGDGQTLYCEELCLVESYICFLSEESHLRNFQNADLLLVWFWIMVRVPANLGLEFCGPADHYRSKTIWIVERKQELHVCAIPTSSNRVPFCEFVFALSGSLVVWPHLSLVAYPSS